MNTSILHHLTPFKVIAAEGEQKASRALQKAADVLQESPSALQVSFLDIKEERSRGYFICRGESNGFLRLVVNV